MIKTTLTPSATEDPLIHSANCFEDSTNLSVITRTFSLSSKQNLLWLLFLVLPYVKIPQCIFSLCLNRLHKIKNILHFLQFCSSVRPNKQLPLNLSHVWFTQCSLHAYRQFSPYDWSHSVVVFYENI